MNKISHFMKSMNFIHRTFSTILLLALVSGCALVQSKRAFPPQNPNAQNLVGQLYYASAKRSFVGDFTARVSQTDFQLDVSKGPGMSLIFVRRNDDALARVEALGHPWQGNPRFAPGIIKSWLALGDALSKAAQSAQPNAVKTNGTQTFALSTGSAKLTTKNGGAERLEVNFPASREHFVFQFSR